MGVTDDEGKVLREGAITEYERIGNLKLNNHSEELTL